MKHALPCFKAVHSHLRHTPPTHRAASGRPKGREDAATVPPCKKLKTSTSSATNATGKENSVKNTNVRSVLSLFASLSPSLYARPHDSDPCPQQAACHFQGGEKIACPPTAWRTTKCLKTRRHLSLDLSRRLPCPRLSRERSGCSTTPWSRRSRALPTQARIYVCVCNIYVSIYNLIPTNIREWCR
jgi:hypothetical protein